MSHDPIVVVTNRTEQMLSVPGQCAKQLICNAFISYFVMLFTFYICTEDHNRLYCLHICKPLNSFIFIKRHLSTLSFVVIVLLLVCVRFVWPSYFDF